MGSKFGLDVSVVEIEVRIPGPQGNMPVDVLERDAGRT
jgi:hypothetical protein